MLRSLALITLWLACGIPVFAQAPSVKQEAWKRGFAQFQESLKHLTDVEERYAAAPQAQKGLIQREYAAAIDESRKLLTLLRPMAIAAYAERPNADPNLSKFLAQAAKEDVSLDRFEQAQPILKLLLDNGCQEPGLANLAGIAAFVLNDYAQAEKLLAAADADGSLNREGRHYLDEIPKYKKLWERELAIRKQEAETNDLPRVRLTTSAGVIVIELFENEAPETVGNFVSLVERKFYDGLPFHRVLAGFMAQGGDPAGDGTGGPNYAIYCECYSDKARMHFRGSLSMAHAGKNTGGSQFFLTFVPTSHLNGRHTVFGRVIEGMDVLGKLKRINPGEPGAGAPDKIVKAEVLRKRNHKYEPRKVE